LEPPPPWEREILADSERGDIANAAVIQIAGACMMDVVAAAPEIIGCECQGSDHASDPVVGAAIAEKRSVPAVMLDHEEANQEPCRRHRHEKCEPVAEPECHPHQEPAERKRARCECKLESTSPRIWITITIEAQRQVSRPGGSIL
jgi:hypothetical protein